MAHESSTKVVSNEVEQSVTDNKASKQRKPPRKRSKVWDHFSDFVDEEGNKKSTCNYCEAEFFADSKLNGTSSMKAHLLICKMNPNNQSSGQTKLSFSNMELDETTGKLKGNLVPWKFDQAKVRHGVAYMIVVDELPFRFVEGKGFKYLMNVACPPFAMPSRTTVTRDCYGLYKEEMDKVKSQIKKSGARVCLTIDSWTSVQKINYFCLTAHFIDENWKLHKKILNFCPLPSHKGHEIGQCIEDCLTSWGIFSVFTVTVDNASSNDTAIGFLKRRFEDWDQCVLGGKWSHIRCVAHIMNLIVRDGLDKVDSSIECVRTIVRYIRQSPARLKRFKELANKEKVEYTKNLCLDVPTRWNSTYMMLEVAQRYEKIFRRFDEDCGGEVSKTLNSGGNLLFPTSWDWANVRRIITFLEGFYNLTLQVSASKYVTSNQFLFDISQIDGLLKRLAESEDANLKAISKLMIEKYDKYWGNKENINVLIFIAAVLDPRYKFQYVSFLLVKMYGDEKGKKMAEFTRDSMNEMFNDYKRLYAPPPTPSTASSSSSTLRDRNTDHE